MTTRRSFLAGMLATGLASGTSWAAVGSPAYLAAARQPDGRHRLLGLSAQGAALFSLPLSGRGHAAAAHPTEAEAVAIDRRPGTRARVINCASGQITARLNAPEGRHFTGHGVFDCAGRLLLTPENDFENGRGRIGIWDRAAGYRRVGDVSSGGIGPHDIQRLPGRDDFVVANGGIDTHPDSGRTPLNRATMRANLALLDLSGVQSVTELAPELRLNSIRHLAIRADGLVGFAMQWQGDSTAHPPLLGLLRPGEKPVLLQAPPGDHAALANYAGSIAFNAAGDRLAISSPRGGQVQIFEVATGQFLTAQDEADVCGLSGEGAGFLATAGTGRIRQIGVARPRPALQHALAFDNHLVAL